MEPPTHILRALADPTRCRILELLADGSRSVNELAQHFSMSRPAVSKHLSILREAALVASRRQGRQQIYDLDASPLGQVREWLDSFDVAESALELAPEPSVAKPTPRRRPAGAGRGDWRAW